MISVVQRVSFASVTIDGIIVGQVEHGLCVLASVVKDDTDTDLKWMADKLAALRVFPNDGKEYDLDLKAAGGGLLLVSNFTVSADASRGRRPGFSAAMAPDTAKVAFDRFVDFARATGVPVATGVFGADMLVRVDNDGPFTVVLNSRRS